MHRPRRAPPPPTLRRALRSLFGRVAARLEHGPDHADRSHQSPVRWSCDALRLDFAVAQPYRRLLYDVGRGLRRRTASQHERGTHMERRISKNRAIAGFTFMLRALILLGIGVFTASPLASAPRFSDWSAPQNLGPMVNSASVDVGPAISKVR